MPIRHVVLSSTVRRAVWRLALVASAWSSGCTVDEGEGSEIDVANQEVDAAGNPLEPLHFIGRFDRSDPRAPVFEWSGSAIWTRFAGTRISVQLGGSANDFELEIDGVRQPVLVHPGGDRTYVLASGLPARQHDLKLTRRTEAFFSTSVFRGFTGARLVGTRRPARHIEVIGDSITCGYGVTGAGPGCSFSHDTEAETRAWAARTADQLGATHHAICWSGIGASRNFNDEPGMLMPQRYPLILPNENTGAWDFSVRPQAVVINLGTNDFSVGVDPGARYVTAMIAFVAQVRGHYPAVPIVLTTSPMLGGSQHTTQRGYLETVAQSDANTTVLDLPEQQASDGFGCDFHPSEVTAQKMADRLKARLRDLLSW